jgi:hypothetical protein
VSGAFVAASLIAMIWLTARAITDWWEDRHGR